VLTAGVVAVAAITSAFIWPITDLIAAHDVSLITGPQRPAHLQTAREAVRTQLVTLGVGAFAAGALWFTARSFTLSRRTFELAERGQRRSFELTEEGQVTDRYTRAIEQLGSDKLDVRIGGVYALERVARDSARDHPTIMEVLAAFIREHSREQWPPSELPADTPERRTRPDVQAATTVIGRRNRTNDRGQIDLARCNLAHADLREADLSGATFYKAVLARAVFLRAQLAGAVLWGADLADAILVDANLTEANLNNANLANANLINANLTGANLVGTNLRGANLGSANLSSAVILSAMLDDTDFTNANLQDAIFTRSVTVPEGWVRSSHAGRLKRAGEQPESIS
jgi:hypothetical protein